jgi:Flp pilus assembly pilin Flp
MIVDIVMPTGGATPSHGLIVVVVAFVVVTVGLLVAGRLRTGALWTARWRCLLGTAGR